MHDGANKLADCMVLTGANLDHLPAFADHTFDSCVTDPPYELGFMGKAWDKSGIAYSVELWREVYRVLKPGAYLLAFGGSRTYHRLASAIEDAGFEIRDQIQWIYGSGFPKSLDVSKAIDKAAGAEREVVGTTTSGKILRSNGDNERPYQQGKTRLEQNVTVAASDAAKTWDGWGTALKPAHEPIVMARKPLEKGLTVAQNALKWGTGAINVDKCRVEFQSAADAADAADAAVGFAASRARGTARQSVSIGKESRDGTNNYDPTKLAGRFPANVIHDGSDEVLAGFPQANGSKPGSFQRVKTSKGLKGGGFGQEKSAMRDKTDLEKPGYEDEGSAARFFYSPKASKYDREAGLPEAGPGEMTDRVDGSDGLNSPRAGAGRTSGGRNHHPTVKPTDLMQYLCRLVTPAGGLILEPFLGSGSTMKAALIERFRCVGIELNAEYAKIAEARCKQLQVKLF